MAKAKVLLMCLLSAQLFRANATWQSLLFQTVKTDAQPSQPPFETFEKYSLLQCTLVCSTSSTCKSLSYGHGICSIYEQEFDMDELETARGVCYHQSNRRNNYETESSKMIVKLQNVARRMPTSQSSGDSSKYAVDGKADTTMPTLTSFCSSTNPDGDEKPWWRYKLEEELVISMVVVYTIPNDHLYNIEVRIGNLDVKDTSLGDNINKNNICVTAKGLLPTGLDPLGLQYARLKCATPLLGNFLSIQITDYCTNTNCKMQDANILNLCQVSVYPDLGNVAMRKPAQQSSDYSSATTADIAVDGVTGQSKISHTKLDDVYPWWRVDLLKDHYVKQVVVYNRGGGSYFQRFHDVEIRVSQSDIAESPPKSIFRDGDTLCAKAGEHEAVPQGRKMFACKKPLAGRYVSLQIVKNCDAERKDCNDRDEKASRQILHMEEVEVIGIPLSYLSSKLGNVAAGKLAQQSSADDKMHPANYALDTDATTFARTRSEPSPWWSVDLESDHYITGVHINCTSSPSKKRLQILVSSRGVTKSEKWGSKNAQSDEDSDNDSLCAESRTDEKKETKIFSCKTPVARRYVRIEIVSDCTKDCSHQKEVGTILWLATVEVIGLPFNETLEAWWRVHNLVSPSSIHEQVGITTNEDKYAQSSTWDGFDAVLAGGSGLLKSALTLNLQTGLTRMYLPSHGYCAFTDIMMYKSAWWKVSLHSTYEIAKIILSTPVELHDFIIRVGNSSANPPSGSNAVCKEGNRLPLSNGTAEVQCDATLAGKYVSIEVMKPCSRTRCLFFKSYALYLCEVEVWANV